MKQTTAPATALKQTDGENKMGVMPVGKLLASMAIPMMISMLVQAFYNVVDSIFVAQLSEDALTAVSLAFPLQSLCIAVGSGTAVGMNAVLSRSLGEKKQDMVDKSANTGIFLFLCSYVVFALIGVFGAHPFFALQTTSETIMEYGVDYTSICLGLSIGIFMQFCFERLLQSTGRTSLAMVTQLIGAVINIIFDPIFIFAKGDVVFGTVTMPFGFGMGVSGAAAATVFGQIVAAIVAIILNVTCNPEVHIRRRLIRWDKSVAPEIYRVGLPSIVMQSIGSVMTFGLNKILMMFTSTAAAVFGVYFKLQSFIFMPVFGLNNGMVPIIAYNYGAAKEDRVKKTVKLTIFAAVCIMSIGAVVMMTIPQTLLSFFHASEQMMTIGVPALRIIATHFFLAGFCIIAGSVCQAIGNPVYSLITSVCRQLVVLLPAAWLLAQTGVLKMIWLAFPIAELMSLLLSSVFLAKTMKKAKAAMAKRQK